MPGLTAAEADDLFQSLQGIWFDRDVELVPGWAVAGGFNPYKGFGSIATFGISPISPAPKTVSIPTRDLVRSRLDAGVAQVETGVFQSLQGIWFDRDPPLSK